MSPDKSTPGEVSPTLAAIRPEDAADILSMWRRYVAAMQALGDPSSFEFDEERFLADGFGPKRAFDGIVARVDGTPAGYLLYHESYDIDRGMRLLFIGNLWVEETMRRRGVGRAMIRDVMRVAREVGAEHLVWGVFNGNAAAFDFYERLGGERTTGLGWMHRAVDPD